MAIQIDKIKIYWEDVMNMPKTALIHHDSQNRQNIRTMTKHLILSATTCSGEPPKGV